MVLGVVAETLVTIDGLEPAGVAAAYREPLGRNDFLDLPDDLLQQFRVSRVRHILLLDGGINDARIECPLVIVVVIDTDALGQYQLHTALADAMAEVHQLRRSARLAR